MCQVHRRAAAPPLAALCAQAHTAAAGPGGAAAPATAGPAAAAPPQQCRGQVTERERGGGEEMDRGGDERVIVHAHQTNSQHSVGPLMLVAGRTLCETSHNPTYF